MASLATIHVVARLVPVDPTGAECHGCGDKCYLEQHELKARLAGMARREVEFAEPIFFCGSCAEIVKERLGE